MKILIIGESCEDVFIYGDCNRLNPEAPTPVFVPKETKKNDGMAANVKSNIISLGYKCDFLTNPEKCVKTRYVDDQSNYILLRVDNDIKYTPMNIDLSKLSIYDIVIISDYNKGLLSESLISDIIRHSKVTIIDTKKEIGEWIIDCDFIKINEKEYLENKKFIDNNLLDKTIITMGGRGCKLKNKTIKGYKVEVRDVVGAGDTFLSALSVKYLETKDIYESMEFANNRSGEVVQKRGVSLSNK